MAGLFDWLFASNPDTDNPVITQQQQQVPPELQRLFASAEGAAGQPYQPYPTDVPRIASLTPDQLAAHEQVRSSQGNYQGALGGAQAGLGNILGQAQAPITSRSITDDSRLSQYMSPYMQNVIDIAKREARRDADIRRAQIGGQFATAGAFGGSRQGILESELDRNLGQNLSDIQVRGSQDAYTQALNQFNTEEQSRLAGAQVGTGRLNVGLGAGQAMGQLGELIQRLGLTGSSALENIGQTQQQQGQRSLDLLKGDFERQRDYPQSQLTWLSNIFRGLPQNQTTTTTAPSQPQSVASQIGGLGLAGLGIWNNIGKAHGGLIGKRFAQGGPVRKFADGGLSTLLQRVMQPVEGMYPKDSKPSFFEQLDNPMMAMAARLLQAPRGQSLAQNIGGGLESALGKVQEQKKFVQARQQQEMQNALVKAETEKSQAQTATERDTLAAKIDNLVSSGKLNKANAEVLRLQALHEPDKAKALLDKTYAEMKNATRALDLESTKITNDKELKEHENKIRETVARGDATEDEGRLLAYKAQANLFDKQADALVDKPDYEANKAVVALYREHLKQAAKLEGDAFKTKIQTARLSIVQEYPDTALGKSLLDTMTRENDAGYKAKVQRIHEKYSKKPDTRSQGLKAIELKNLRRDYNIRRLSLGLEPVEE